MTKLCYEKRGLTLSRGVPNDPAFMIDLQRHLRALGYLRSGVDGKFGGMTESAVRALKDDLLHHYGAGRGGSAQVGMPGYNRSRVFCFDGQVEENLPPPDYGINRLSIAARWKYGSMADHFPSRKNS